MGQTESTVSFLKTQSFPYRSKSGTKTGSRVVSWYRTRARALLAKVQPVCGFTVTSLWQTRINRSINIILLPVSSSTRNAITARGSKKGVCPFGGFRQGANGCVALPTSRCNSFRELICYKFVPPDSAWRSAARCDTCQPPRLATAKVTKECVFITLQHLSKTRFTIWWEREGGGGLSACLAAAVNQFREFATANT